MALPYERPALSECFCPGWRTTSPACSRSAARSSPSVYVVEHFMQRSARRTLTPCCWVTHGNNSDRSEVWGNLENTPNLRFIKRSHPACSKTHRGSGDHEVFHSGGCILKAVKVSPSLPIYGGGALWLGAHHQAHRRLCHEPLAQSCLGQKTPLFLCENSTEEPWLAVSRTWGQASGLHQFFYGLAGHEVRGEFSYALPCLNRF